MYNHNHFRATYKTPLCRVCRGYAEVPREEKYSRNIYIQRGVKRTRAFRTQYIYIYSSESRAVSIARDAKTNTGGWREELNTRIPPRKHMIHTARRRHTRTHEISCALENSSACTHICMCVCVCECGKADECARDQEMYFKIARDCPMATRDKV